MEKFTKKGLEGILILASIAGWIIAIVALFVFAPWGPGLGYPFSTERLIAAYVVFYGFLLPPALYFLVYQFKRPRWLAPVGKYSEGMKVNPFSPYHLVAMGVMAALFASTGFLSAINVDLASFTASFTAVFFGPWITLVALFAGNVIRWLSGTAWWLNPTNIMLNGLTDAFTWVINGGLYIRFAREKPFTSNRLLRFIVFYVIFQGIHAFMWVFLFSIINFPIEGAIQNIVGTLTSWYPGAMIFTLVGFYVAETMYELRTSPVVRAQAPEAPKE
ncbi:MAG: hypothetical protein ACTSW4_05030 [Candidatus Ranarchaeia archaeon]